MMMFAHTIVIPHLTLGSILGSSPKKIEDDEVAKLQSVIVTSKLLLIHRD